MIKQTIDQILKDDEFREWASAMDIIATPSSGRSWKLVSDKNEYFIFHRLREEINKKTDKNLDGFLILLGGANKVFLHRYRELTAGVGTELIEIFENEIPIEALANCIYYIMKESKK